MSDKLILIFLFFGVRFIYGGPAPFYPSPLPIDGLFLVGAEPNQDLEELKKTLIVELGFSAISINRILEAPPVLLANFERSLIDKVANVPGVAYIEDDAAVELQGGKENLEPELPEWHLDRINQRTLPLDGNADFGGEGSPTKLDFLNNMECAAFPDGGMTLKIEDGIRDARTSNRGKGVHIYFLDTGILKGHEEFRGKEKISFDFKAGGDGIDCNGHGTHAAALAAGVKYGVAKNATVHGVKICGCRGHSTKSYVAKGINWIARKRRLPCVVQFGVSSDLGGSKTLDNGAKVLTDLGCVVVAPAGNNGNDSCLVSPGRTEEEVTTPCIKAITVGALATWDYIFYNSNWGKCIDIFAPGQNIMSGWYISTHDNDTLSGTSMSASQVAGAAAIKLSDGIKPDKVKAKLIKESTKGKMHGVLNGAPSRMLYVKPPDAKTKKQTEGTWWQCEEGEL